MKHFNKQLEVNLNLMEPNNPKQDKKAIMEGINIIILIVLGFTGLFFYINAFSHKTSTNASRGLTANAAFSSNKPTQAKATVPAIVSSSERLILEGQRKAGEKIKVTIINFNKTSDYKIDFGDGIVKEINTRKTYHTYSNSGHYDIQLTINQKDQLPKEVSKQIQIDSATEAASDNAYQKQ